MMYHVKEIANYFGNIYFVDCHRYEIGYLMCAGKLNAAFSDFDCLIPCI